MKRFLSVGLMILLLLQCISFTAFAETKLILHPVANIINQIEGDGFYDNAAVGGPRGFEHDHTHVILRMGEWVCYDISALDAGRYKVSLNYGSPDSNKVTVEIDGEKAINSKYISATGGYVKYKTTELGYVDLSGTQKRFKIVNENTKADTIYLETITLEKLPDVSLSSVTANIEPESGVFARGTDSITAIMEVAINRNSIGDGDIILKDEDKNNVPFEATVSGKNITLNLLTSLDYGKEYTLYMSGIEGSSGEQMSKPIEYSFYTNDESDKRGNASLEVTDLAIENSVLKISGIVKSSKGLGISERDVVAYVTPPSGGNKVKVQTVTSGDFGKFEMAYEMPDNSENGKHFVEIATEYIAEPYNDFFLYFSEKFESQAVADLSNIKTIEGVEAAFNKYLPYTEVDTEDIENMITDISSVYEQMLEREFDTTKDAFKAIEKSVYFVCITQTDDADKIVSVLDDKTKSSVFEGFNYPLWSALDDNSKLSVAESVKDAEMIYVEDLAELLEKETQKAYAEENNLKTTTISATSTAVKTGEILKISVNAENALENIYGLHFEFDYSDEVAALFESEDIVVNTMYDAEFENLNDNNRFIVDIKAVDGRNIQTSSGVLFTIDIPASAKTGGTHDIILNGEVVYNAEQVGKIKLPLDVSDDLTINIEEITSKEINAPDIIELTDGVGYYDNPDAGGFRGFEKYDTTVCFRENEWAVYNISGLAYGEYEVSVSHADTSDTTITLFVDDKEIAAKSLATTGDYGAYKEGIVGKVKLSGEQKYLKLKTNVSATYIRTITLIRIDKFKVKSVTANVPKTNGVYSKGADCFVVEFNNAVIAESLISENVSITDENGKELSARLNVSQNNIVIALMESLKANNEYTLNINNIEDRFGQILEKEYIWNFKTATEDITDGEASIEISDWEVTDDSFVVKGRVLSSNGVGISGRKVALYGKYGDSSYDEWGKTQSGENGEFSILYTFSNCKSGEYKALLDTEFLLEAYEEEVLYYDAEASKEIASVFSGLETADEVERVLAENSSALGIDVNQIKEDVDISYITKAMINRTYNKASQIVEEVNKRYILEKVNQTTDIEKIKNIIENEKEIGEIGKIQREKWNILSDDEKTEVVELVIENIRISSPDELLVVINNAINHVLKERYQIAVPAVSVTSADINEGQSAELIFSFEERQEDIKNIYLEIGYDESDVGLFENNIKLTTFKDLSAMTVSSKNEKGKMIFYLSLPMQKGKTAICTEKMFTVSFVAEKGTEGIYNPEISGYVTYHKDEANPSEAYSCDVPFALVSNPEIKVSATTVGGNNDFSGGGRPGGGSYGASGSTSGGGGTALTSDKVWTTDEGIIQSPIFTDLDSALWAKGSIEALSLKGVVSGRGDGSFAPNDNVTRAEFCKMITLALNLVNEQTMCDFSDVKKDDWYYVYIASAKEAGLVNGKTENEFLPNDTITRQEMATIAYRALQFEGLINEKALFTDDAEIAEYAKIAVCTLKEKGILNGVGDNMFAPESSVTRAMAAKLIYGIMNL